MKIRQVFYHKGHKGHKEMIIISLVTVFFVIFGVGIFRNVDGDVKADGLVT
jgi:hypothetical protein